MLSSFTMNGLKWHARAYLSGCSVGGKFDKKMRKIVIVIVGDLAL